MKILLATDGSADAVHAANFLLTLECKEPISLTVLTTSYAPNHIDSATSQAWFPQWRQLEDERVSQHHEEMRALLSPLDSNLTCSHIEGSAANEILKSASASDADLIVLGACGHSAIGRIVLGSVSDDVATHAECSVLIVRPETAASEDNTCTCRMTFAYDGSDSSTAAVDEVKRFQWPSCSSVNVLTVVQQPGFIMSDYPVLIQEHNDVSIDDARLTGEKLIAALSSQIDKPTAQVALGEHIGETIIENANEAGSNLIMLGDTGRGFLGTLMLGSVSKYVLRHATCSVWISRHHRQSNG